MPSLKVALMGTGAAGEAYLSAIRADRRLSLQAVADTDGALGKKNADELTVPSYRDYRSLLVETAQAGLDLLVVALEPYESLPFVEMAAARGIPVLHKAPFARNVREGQRLVDLFAESGRPFVVSRRWQHEPAFGPLLELARPVEQVLAATAWVYTTDTAAGWRGDASRAGGGVLLNGAYEVIDLLVHVLGAPDSVYARCAAGRPPTHSGEEVALRETKSFRAGVREEGASFRAHETEDAAVVCLDFGHNGIASVTALRGAPQAGWRVTLVQGGSQFELTEERMTISSRGCDAPEQRTVWTKHPVSNALDAVCSSLLAGEEVLRSTAAEHLQTLAAIEAAYLSSKTGQPESPARLR